MSNQETSLTTAGFHNVMATIPPDNHQKPSLSHKDVHSRVHDKVDELDYIKKKFFRRFYRLNKGVHLSQVEQRFKKQFEPCVQLEQLTPHNLSGSQSRKANGHKSRTKAIISTCKPYTENRKSIWDSLKSPLDTRSKSPKECVPKLKLYVSDPTSHRFEIAKYSEHSPVDTNSSSHPAQCGTKENHQSKKSNGFQFSSDQKNVEKDSSTSKCDSDQAASGVKTSSRSAISAIIGTGSTIPLEKSSLIHGASVDAKGVSRNHKFSKGLQPTKSSKTSHSMVKLSKPKGSKREKREEKDEVKKTISKQKSKDHHKMSRISCEQYWKRKALQAEGRIKSTDKNEPETITRPKFPHKVERMTPSNKDLPTKDTGSKESACTSPQESTKQQKVPKYAKETSATNAEHVQKKSVQKHGNECDQRNVVLAAKNVSNPQASPSTNNLQETSATVAIVASSNSSDNSGKSSSSCKETDAKPEKQVETQKTKEHDIAKTVLYSVTTCDQKLSQHQHGEVPLPLDNTNDASINPEPDNYGNVTTPSEDSAVARLSSSEEKQEEIKTCQLPTLLPLSPSPNVRQTRAEESSKEEPQRSSNCSTTTQSSKDDTKANIKSSGHSCADGEDGNASRDLKTNASAFSENKGSNNQVTDSATTRSDPLHNSEHEAQSETSPRPPTVNSEAHTISLSANAIDNIAVSGFAFDQKQSYQIRVGDKISSMDGLLEKLDIDGLWSDDETTNAQNQGTDDTLVPCENGSLPLTKSIEGETVAASSNIMMQSPVTSGMENKPVDRPIEADGPSANRPMNLSKSAMSVNCIVMNEEQADVQSPNAVSRELPEEAVQPDGTKDKSHNSQLTDTDKTDEDALSKCSDEMVKVSSLSMDGLAVTALDLSETQRPPDSERRCQSAPLAIFTADRQKSTADQSTLVRSPVKSRSMPSLFSLVDSPDAHEAQRKDDQFSSPGSTPILHNINKLIERHIDCSQHDKSFSVPIPEGIAEDSRAALARDWAGRKGVDSPVAFVSPFRAETSSAAGLCEDPKGSDSEDDNEENDVQENTKGKEKISEQSDLNAEEITHVHNSLGNGLPSETDEGQRKDSVFEDDAESMADGELTIRIEETFSLADKDPLSPDHDTLRNTELTPSEDPVPSAHSALDTQDSLETKPKDKEDKKNKKKTTKKRTKTVDSRKRSPEGADNNSDSKAAAAGSHSRSSTEVMSDGGDTADELEAKFLSELPEEDRPRKASKKPRNSLSGSPKEDTLVTVDADDMPTIHPPKRRRSHLKRSSDQPPSAKQCLQNVEEESVAARLNKEFRRHNWLEKKIARLDSEDLEPETCQTKTEDRNTTVRPVCVKLDFEKQEMKNHFIKDISVPNPEMDTLKTVRQAEEDPNILFHDSPDPDVLYIATPEPSEGSAKTEQRPKVESPHSTTSPSEDGINLSSRGNKACGNLDGFPVNAEKQLAYPCIPLTVTSSLAVPLDARVSRNTAFRESPESTTVPTATVKPHTQHTTTFSLPSAVPKVAIGQPPPLRPIHTPQNISNIPIPQPSQHQSISIDQPFFEPKVVRFRPLLPKGSVTSSSMLPGMMNQQGMAMQSPVNITQRPKRHAEESIQLHSPTKISRLGHHAFDQTMTAVKSPTDLSPAHASSVVSLPNTTQTLPKMTDNLARQHSEPHSTPQSQLKLKEHFFEEQYAKLARRYQELAKVEEAKEREKRIAASKKQKAAQLLKMMKEQMTLIHQKTNAPEVMDLTRKPESPVSKYQSIPETQSTAATTDLPVDLSNNRSGTPDSDCSHISLSSEKKAKLPLHVMNPYQQRQDYVGSPHGSHDKATVAESPSRAHNHQTIVKYVISSGPGEAHIKKDVNLGSITNMYCKYTKDNNRSGQQHYAHAHSSQRQENEQSMPPLQKIIDSAKVQTGHASHFLIDNRDAVAMSAMDATLRGHRDIAPHTSTPSAIVSSHIMAKPQTQGPEINAISRDPHIATSNASHSLMHLQRLSETGSDATKLSKSAVTSPPGNHYLNQQTMPPKGLLASHTTGQHSPATSEILKAPLSAHSTGGISQPHNIKLDKPGHFSSAFRLHKPVPKQTTSAPATQSRPTHIQGVKQPVPQTEQRRMPPTSHSALPHNHPVQHAVGNMSMYQRPGFSPADKQYPQHSVSKSQVPYPKGVMPQVSWPQQQVNQPLTRDNTYLQHNKQLQIAQYQQQQHQLLQEKNQQQQQQQQQQERHLKQQQQQLQERRMQLELEQKQRQQQQQTLQETQHYPHLQHLRHNRQPSMSRSAFTPPSIQGVGPPPPYRPPLRQDHFVSRSTEAPFSHDMEARKNIVKMSESSPAPYMMTAGKSLNSPQGSVAQRGKPRKPSSVVAPMSCDVCANKAKFVCSGCKLVSYCSPHCQMQAWTIHSLSCGQ